MFTSGEVQRLVEVSQQDLTYWDRSGLVQPTGRSAHGKGSRRLYTTMDVLQLKLVRRLRDAGLTLQRIRKALSLLKAMGDDPVPLAELEVLSDGRRIIVRRSDDVLLDPVASQYMLRLPLSLLLTELSQNTKGEQVAVLAQRASASAVSATV